MKYETLLTEIIDTVQILKMNRPEKLNAWNPLMGEEIIDAINQANINEDIVAMVISGEGKGFCAGADIDGFFKKKSEGGEVKNSNVMSGWVKLIRESKPIVAAINGAAIGVGLTKVLPMDFIIASEGAKLSMRFSKMGLVPELASSHFLTTRVGFGNASEIMLSGRTLVASEAKELGLIDKVVSGDDLIREAIAYAKSMGNNPQISLKYIKYLLTVNGNEIDLELIQKREQEALQKCYKTEEHKEAISSFIEKREPDFKSARSKNK
tara:strand:+ start:1108 stop:1905 length:798 start_codon:yes stop_codon:yes gene_type:complete